MPIQQNVQPRNEPVAIVGCGCRFPGGSNAPSKLWELLRQPHDLLTRIPQSRFSAEGFYHPDGLYHGHSNVRDSYLLSEDPRHFDAQFFGIKPVEANAMDPQQRLLLETVYESIEAAGLTLEGLQGSDTGVYVGLMCGDYEAMLLRDYSTIPTYHATGIARSIMSNRISYFFDWHGPSMTIDTACSSSLVAVHQAVQALRGGDSRVALACGSNLLLGPENYVAESKLKMLSPDSRSRMWDQDANGYARGDGVAAIVLKTLSAALEDGDHIECLIRETSINQDGKTKGITMPSATAQAALIRQTYEKAGLNPRNEQERCQYFEAHGTGTPAGDPVEANAINAAFFGGSTMGVANTQEPLFVGSIKTVVGHTEGTAGLAALMKASLALQNATIPPNMLFNQLSSAVAPFYDNLEVPVVATPWPNPNLGQPRRASVNSFGFGGSNAHAILESYELSDGLREGYRDISTFMPFTFSANSERSLVANLGAYSSYLKSNPGISLRDLAWTLHARRSKLPVKAAFAATSIESLCSQIDAQIGESAETVQFDFGTRSQLSPGSRPPRVLGIFTGQGAQYARMGAELILKSPYVRDTIQSLEDRLKRLPALDRPSWSLKDELLADMASSRVNEAALSQPLCTAVQIVLVDLLRSARIEIDAVVGHSSGEIAAAYAAGYISAQDAICIAYYRGFYAKLAVGSAGKEGAMLAVGTSFEDAQELCSDDHFAGRLAVAACNSSTSVTLSGDLDAIAEAEIIFEDEKRFKRRLKVDKAYHSYHMLPCIEAYRRSLRACDIRVQRPSSTCTWFSSVNDCLTDPEDELRAVYWEENMAKPVLFSQAIRKAYSTNTFDVAIEIGPHPALKGPVTQTVQDITNESIPYTGLLSRGQHDVEAFALALGFIWVNIGNATMDLENFERTISNDAQFSLLKNLPTYQWDHNREYWQESRLSRAFRTREESGHELLGTRTTDSTRLQISWRNRLRVQDLPWIRGHQLQNQTVFPAAGYIATALEASKSLIESTSAKLIEVKDFTIHQAMVFHDDESGIETLFVLTDVDRTSQDCVAAKFAYYSVVGKESDVLTLMASGILELQFGAPSAAVLPPRSPPEPNMVKVETDRFYSSLEALGYGYTGPFRALSSLQRKLGRATGLISSSAASAQEAQLMAHPAMLDAAIQSVILAFCYPNDGELWSLHLPTSIRRIRVNPDMCRSQHNEEMLLPFDSAITIGQGSGIFGDVDVYTENGHHPMLQMEGMRAVPFSPATSADDVKLFSHMQWKLADPNGDAIVWDSRASSEEYDLAYILERVASFYLRKLDQEIPLEHLARSEGPYKGLFNFASHVNALVSAGRHPYAKQEWVGDSFDKIMEITKSFPDSPDLQIMHVVGEQIPRVIRGETTILEHLLPNNLLDNYYVNALGFPQFSKWLARMVGQITHRYPHMNILEIGAGTGGATKSILQETDKAYSAYTFTDVSNGFFEKAQTVFEAQEGKMTFKVLDIEKDIAAQGFTDGSYDLIIASFVIHATKKLEHSMRNVRRLLKPGGHVLMAEVTNNDQIRGGFIFGALPGWWLGADDGRVLSPCVSSAQWDTILRNTGFAGIDAITPDSDRFPYPGSVFASQAVDDRINFLRQPLSPSPGSVQSLLVIGELIIIGGLTLKTSRLVGELNSLLRPFCLSMTSFKSIEDVGSGEISSTSTVLSLAELDEPLFKSMTVQQFDSLKTLFGSEKTMVWVTEGRRADNPYSNMTIGFGRSQLWEVPDLRLQFVDFESPQSLDARALAETLLRFKSTSSWSQEGIQNNLLWSIEPELVVSLDSQHLIPRLAPVEASNDRYNSFRRALTRNLDPRTSTVEIVKSETGYSLQDISRPLTMSPQTGASSSVKVQVNYSLFSALYTPAGAQYLVLGTIMSSGKHVVGLSELQASIVNLSEDRLVCCSIPEGLEGHYLVLIAANILAMVTVGKMSLGESLLVHEATPAIATILSLHAAQQGIQVTYTTCRTDTTQPWLSIHPKTPARTLKALMPKDISFFVDLSLNGEAQDVGSCFKSYLEPQCRHETAATLLPDHSYAFPQCQKGTILTFLKTALSHAYKDPVGHRKSMHLDKVVLSRLSVATRARDLHSFIDWTEHHAVPAQILPIDATMLFAADKTYWLVGLTGGLGLSLCEWMIRHGAKYVVITSRNPKVDPIWLERTKAMGAMVKIFSNDVTNEKELQELYREIQATLPPVAGVAQGAMVLKDVATREMNHEDMTRVLKPKVDGSVHLDRLFADQKLDFFIFFSSMTGVIGNMGQANYTAANTFMCSLAAQRRKRGLAASVINIGVVIGVGYVTREVSQADQKNLHKGGYMWMSERDFHRIFAEAVLAGRPDSNLELEISTGLRHVAADAPYLPIWINNPKFAKFVLQNTAMESQESTAKSGVPIKSQLLAATSNEEVYKVLMETFVSKLQAMLQIDPSDSRSNESMADLRTDDLGLDSLNAVEIRSWFFKNYQVNMPVLKILGGVSIRELIDYALESISADLIPNVKTSIILEPDPGASEMKNETATEVNPLYGNSGASTGASPSEKTGLASTEGTVTPASSTSETRSNFEAESIKPRLARSEALSFGQSMFWFVTALLDDKTTLNHTASFSLSGHLRVNDLEMAVRTVGQRHEALRTCFYLDDNQKLHQGVLESTPLYLERQQIKHNFDHSREFEALKSYVYDLERGETMRVRLLSLSPISHYLLIGCHHINMDGVSHQVLMSDLEKVYNQQTLSPNVLQYPDFSVRQHKEHQNGEWREELAFWRNEFDSVPQPLPLLTLGQSASRRTLTNYEISRVDCRIDPEFALRIRGICRQQRSTSFHFYLAAFHVLLSRYTGLEDICIGIGDSNRTEIDMLESIGPFVNILPVRLRSLAADSFSELLKQARSKSHLALANSRVPFEVLLNELHVTRSPTHSPLFQAFVDYRQGAQEKQSFGNCELEMKNFEAGRTAYDLSLDIIDNAGGDTLLMLMVQKSLYSETDAQVLMKSYVDILQHFSRTPELRIKQLPLYRPVDQKDALEVGRGSKFQSQWPPTLPHRIDLIMQKEQQSIALKDAEGNALTYYQTASRVNSIATTLLESGCCSGSRVAVLQEPNADWICSILAILKVGAVYVPLDLATPLMRMSSMINDCQPSAILYHNTTQTQLTSLDTRETKIINISILPRCSTVAVPVSARPESPAVILYTSGTTGVPKGIILKHSSFLNEVEVSAKIYGLKQEVILQQSAVGFDMSLLQIFLAFSLGGTLCLLPRALRGDSVAVTKFMVDEGVSYTCATPSEYTSWLHYGDTKALQMSAWRVALSGGESITEALLERFRTLGKSDLRLFNGYGPTETTCCSTKMELNYAEGNNTPGRIAAGSPSPNESIYLLDENLQLVPIGFPGEIAIGGAGVAVGYLDSAKSGGSNFIPDVYAADDYVLNGWTTMYRTGDRGRWLKDGTLLIEGRIADDTQVKLRGLRIDLRDVEETIMKTASGSLAEAVVSHRSSANGAQFLVAHVVFLPAFPPADRAVFLRNLSPKLPLPQYMRPAVVVELKKMPTTISSKLDRRTVSALPIPQAIIEESDNTALSATEVKLKGIWIAVLTEEVVSHYSINADVDFFHVGGNSMLLVDLQAQIRTSFDVSLSLIELFESSSLASMALRIENTAKALEKDAIDWESETQVSSDLDQLAMFSSSQPPASTPKVIVLTGATGFLGQHLLQRLIADEAICEIHCIAVRRLAEKKPLLDHNKVRAYEGDLRLPLLGLTEEMAGTIFHKTDVVIHNGADVSHLKSYATLKKANMESTKEIVKLCLPRQVPIHYISTAGVALFSAKDAFEEVSVSSTPPPPDGSDGYTASKWASERYLEKMNVQYGLPVWIHRPSSIVRPPGQTGEDAPVLDLLQNLLKYSREMRAVPTSPNLRGALNLISVKQVTDGIISHIVNDCRAVSGEVAYVHQTGDHDLPIAGMKEFLEQESGQAVEVVPIGEWAARAESAGLHSTVVAAFKNVERLGVMSFPRFVKKGFKGS